MPTLVPIPGEAGWYFVPELKKKVQILEAYEGAKYDTVRQASGAITAGTRLVLFRNLTDKDEGDINFTTQRRLAAGEVMLADFVFVDVQGAFGNTIVLPRDIKKALYGGLLTIKINKSVVASGPLVMFPGGFGLAGSTTENDAGIVANGVPSPAAVRKLARPQELTEKHDWDGEVRFDDHVWDATNMPTLTGKVHIKAGMYGSISAPATK